MTKKNFYHGAWKLRATAALVLALALSTFPAAFSRAVNAQTPAKATSQIPAKTTTPPASQSKGGQQEGIKVHGHWTIDVRNPDGTLVTHREFDNALTSGGGAMLSQTLGRIFKPSLWQIFLGPIGPSPWSNSLSGSIVEPNDSLPLAPNISKNLSLCVGGFPCTFAGVSQPNVPVGTFLLSGSISAQQDGTIGNVETWLALCPTSGTNACDNPRAFTIRQLALPLNGSCPPNTQCVVNVVTGQIIQVSVRITFS